MEQRFSWFAGASIMEIWNAIFTILTLPTHTRRYTNRLAPSPPKKEKRMRSASLGRVLMRILLVVCSRFTYTNVTRYNRRRE